MLGCRASSKRTSSAPRIQSISAPPVRKNAKVPDTWPSYLFFLIRREEAKEKEVSASLYDGSANSCCPNC